MLERMWKGWNTPPLLVGMRIGTATGGAVVKNPPANAGDKRDAGSIPESGRSPGGGHGNPLQHSCLENPMDRGAWWATVHRSQSRTQPKRLCMHTCTIEGITLH